MSGDNSWTIWLTHEGGETLLGLSPTGRVDHRFCVLGTFESDGPNGVGIWINVDFVQEITVPDNTTIKTWQVSPRSCLILWAYVAYIQRGERVGNAGFTVSSSK